MKSPIKSPVKNRKSKSPVRVKRKSKSTVDKNRDESFIDCVQRIKGNLNDDPEKLINCLYTMINDRKNVDKYDHQLVNKNNLYKSVVVYCSAHLSNDDIHTIKKNIKSFKHTGKHDTVKNFLKDVKFEKLS